ncbi:MAG: hypothetical protein V2L15_01750 [Desulfobacteraceae bacterium]|jgi:hypothetical protein|nr:hypothetical protein [Desulfobacteraceae bacterium]
MKQVKLRKTAVQGKAEQSVSSGTIFDFEIGTLIQSPCRHCEMRSLLPDCCQHCELLAQIQTTLASGISSGHSVSPAEDYCLAVNER